MSPRRHQHADNPDWPMIVQEVSVALDAYRNWSANDDPYKLIQTLGDALLALAEHNNVDSAYIYGTPTETSTK